MDIDLNIVYVYFISFLLFRCRLYLRKNTKTYVGLKSLCRSIEGNFFCLHYDLHFDLVIPNKENQMYLKFVFFDCNLSNYQI